ncbi:Uncharacterised protein [Mycobacteroides abscessus subsp. abscessus]|nr:Uncharacterised protein [Mycobacteroides abscessus subsp. abscessus]
MACSCLPAIPVAAVIAAAWSVVNRMSHGVSRLPSGAGNPTASITSPQAADSRWPSVSSHESSASPAIGSGLIGILRI